MPRPKMRETVQTLLNPDVLDELAKGVPGFDRAGFLAGVFEAWGGQGAFAKDVVLEFKHSKAGAISRQRILDMICRMLSQHSNDNHVHPVEEMSDDELRAEIQGAVAHLSIWPEPADG